MIGYGQAFVIGWLFFVILKMVLERKSGRPWNHAPLIWGATFAVLNWITTLWRV